MKTYVVMKAFPGHKALAEVQYDPADVADYVASGSLKEKDATAIAEADSEIDSAADAYADRFLAKAASKINQKTKGAPFALTVPSDLGQHAQPKEESSFSEWLWALSGQAQTADVSKAVHCKNLLINKYHSTVNDKFGEEYKEAVSKGGGSFDQSGNAVSKAVQVEGVAGLGGVAVPPEYSRELFRLAGDQSLLLNKVKRYTMAGKELRIPAIDYTKGGSGKSPYLAGMNAVWTGENVGFTQENANLRQVELVANLLAGYTQASRSLLADDQVALGQVLTDLFSKAIAFNVDYAIFTGSGTNMPKGMIKSAACKTFQRGTWTSNGVLLSDLAKADSFLIPEMEGEAIWVLPPSFKQDLYPMNDGSGKVVFLANGAPGPEGAAVMRPSMSVFGKNLYWSQLPASAGTTGDVNLIIPSLYAFGVRDNIEIGVSEHFAWTTNLLTYRFLFRGDGQSLLNNTLTLQNGDVVAPFVSITT